MSCRQISDPLVALEEWLLSPLGRELVTRETECLERMLADVFGYYLLQVGMTIAYGEAAGSSPARRRILIPLTARREVLGTQVAAAPDRLPVAGDSVDAVLLPHTLDFVDDPRQVLREVERVLIAEGRVLILGFNAMSLWGLWGLIRGGKGRVPWCGRFLTPFRVVDWLSLLGFDVERQEMMMFRPPWPRTLFQRLSFVEPAGRRFWPPLGGVYAIRAVKRVSTLTPLRPSWNVRRPVLHGGRVEPSPRRVVSRGAAGGRIGALARGEGRSLPTSGCSIVRTEHG